jgi:hypothetical protein|tara:strand:+ start:2818 stop:3057 length:240 start_codon:yes stop_codon:yes gene_type:complete
MTFKEEYKKVKESHKEAVKRNEYTRMAFLHGRKEGMFTGRELTAKEIIKIIEDLESKHNGSWIITEIKNSIKAECLTKT